jgi:hypothetical protein
MLSDFSDDIQRGTLFMDSFPVVCYLIFQTIYSKRKISASLVPVVWYLIFQMIYSEIDKSSHRLYVI